MGEVDERTNIKEENLGKHTYSKVIRFEIGFCCSKWQLLLFDSETSHALVSIKTIMKSTNSHYSLVIGKLMTRISLITPIWSHSSIEELMHTQKSRLFYQHLI